MKLICLIVLICFNSTIGFGQKAFDAELKSLYKKTVPLILTEELEVLKSQGIDLVILDTRTLKEYQVSHIDDARLVDFDHFKIRNLDSIPKDKKVIVYCSVGYRSERIGEKLQKAGYIDVSNLYGGIFQWKNDGKIVVNYVDAPTDSVHTYNKDWSKWLYKGVKVYE